MTIEHLNMLIKHRNLLATKYDKLNSYIDEIEKVDEFRIAYRDRGRPVTICSEAGVPPYSEIISDPFFHEMKNVYLKNLKMLRSELESKIERINNIVESAKKALDEIKVLEETA